MKKRVSFGIQGSSKGISYSSIPDSQIKERILYTNTMKRNSNLQKKKCIIYIHGFSST